MTHDVSLFLATAIYTPLFPPAFGLLGKTRLARQLEEEEVAADEQKENEVGVKETSS
jgi:hypothetical protein